MAKSAAKFSVHLDAMRGIAALAVFLMHGKGLFIGSVVNKQAANVAAGTTTVNQFELTTSLAHEAVIVFFVLSGFLVGGGVLRAWQKHVWTWKTYAIQRLTRLWIVLIPALLLTLALDTAGLHFFGLDNPYGRPHWEGYISTAILSTLNAKTFFGCVFFLQRILVEPLGSNGALWTLSYEFWFYVGFPLGLAAISARFSWPVRLLNAVLCVGAGIFVGPRISAYFSIWLLGAALQLVPKRIPARLVRVLAPGGVILLLAVSAALCVFKWHIFVSDAIEALTCAGLCYVLLHETSPAREGSLYVSASRHLSDMSYTLYLTHLPILTFFCALLTWRGIGHGHSADNLMVYACVSVVTFALSYLCYLCFEKHSDRVRGVLLAAFNRPAKPQAVETGVLS